MNNIHNTRLVSTPGRDVIAHPFGKILQTYDIYPTGIKDALFTVYSTVYNDTVNHKKIGNVNVIQHIIHHIAVPLDTTKLD